MGKNLTLKVTAPLAAFGALSIKTAADFSKAMAQVNAVTGATVEQFEELNSVARELGRTTQFTATQVAEAMSFMGMAGMTTDQILSAIPDTLNLAAAGALDMGSAANIVTNILAGFGMETDQLGGAVDVLAKAFTSSNTDLLMLGESMKYAGPVAKGFGMSFEETAAIMGIFGNAGIQASMAGTSLRGAIVQLNSKAEQFGITMYDSAGKMIPMADILEQLEKKGLTAGEMMDLFGLRAGPAMTALLDKGSQALRDFTAELEDAGGTAEYIAKTQMEGLHGSLIRLKSAFEGLQLSIADHMAPTVEALIGKLITLFNWFSDLPSSIRTTVIAIAAFAAALGPAIWFTGFFIKQLIALKLAFIAVTGSSIVTTAVLKIMIAMSVGLKTAFVILTGIALALALGIGMIVFAISQLIKNSRTREEQARREAEREEILIRLKAEHAKMMKGLDNEYIKVLREAKELGFVIGEEQEAYLRAIDVQELYQETLGLTTDMTVAEELALKRTNEALAEQIRLRERLQPVVEAYREGVITWETFVALRGQTQAAQAKLAGYAHGGPILGPTLLTNLNTMQPYAVAGEKGREWVGPSGGGTANIFVELDGRVIARAIGAPLVDEIRLRTGAQY